MHVAQAARRSDELAADEYIGGMRAGGWNATRPLVVVSIDRAGVKCRPRWRGLGVLPHVEFDWPDVERVVELVGPLGERHGLRFALNAAPRVSGGVTLGNRGQRPTVWLRARDIDKALAAVPSGIPRTRAYGLVIWPELRARIRAR
jgi:hypothetical protein